jgi:hypothetical protein
MPTRIHIPKNWKYRATRALSNLNKPGFAAACFWCGHQYRSGEYSPETESEHLLLCPEFPKKGKQNIQKRKASEAEPKVGVLFLVGGKLLIDSTPLSQAGHYGHHLIHERGHDEYWGQLVKMGAVPGAEYEEYPRGRVAYDTKRGKFTLLADKCILDKKSIVGKIVSVMNLPVGTEKRHGPALSLFPMLGARSLTQPHVKRLATSTVGGRPSVRKTPSTILPVSPLFREPSNQ